MSDAFASIERGMKEALANARGEDRAKVHEIERPMQNVRAIRTR